jgi:hypothetical protein
VIALMRPIASVYVWVRQIVVILAMDVSSSVLTPVKTSDKLTAIMFEIFNCQLRSRRMFLSFSRKDGDLCFERLGYTQTR